MSYWLSLYYVLGTFIPLAAVVLIVYGFIQDARERRGWARERKEQARIQAIPELLSETEFALALSLGMGATEKERQWTPSRC